MKTLFTAVLLLAFTAPAQDWAKARLDNSPRHIEWVKIKHGNREVNCTIAFPEIKEKATTVIVIHEIFGLTDWVRGVADQLAEAGYIAIAPDLLSGCATNGGGTADLGGGDAVRKAISGLKPEQVTADLDAVADYATKLPASNGKVAVGGFCWGGTQSFRYATNNKKLKAAFPFYGSAPESAEELARIECPVHGFYAANDNRINATLPKTTEQMKAAKKTYEPITYDGAGHGFMRAGEAPDKGNNTPEMFEANQRARAAAWQRWKDLLKKL